MYISTKGTACNLSLLILIILASLCSSLVSAHINLSQNGTTPPRYNSDDLKHNGFDGINLCAELDGDGNLKTFAGPPTNIRSIFTEGQIIDVQWIETVSHDGDFYIDFAPSINGPFTTPLVIPDPVNQIPQEFTAQFELNFPPCENCILRFRQDMGNNLDGEGERIYYSCADIAIVDLMDTTPPGLISVTPTTTDTSISLDWSNALPADISEILIIRVSGSVMINDLLSKNTHYNVGDNTTSAIIIAKLDGNTTSYVDVGLTPVKQYSYKIYARDSNYNYNGGTNAIVTTSAASVPTPTPTPTPTPSPGDTTTQKPVSSKGALFGILGLLLGLFVYRRFHSK